MENNNKLILEVERIKQIIGVELLTEGVNPQLLDDVLTYLGKVLKSTGNASVDVAIRELNTKVAQAARANRRVLIGDVIDDLFRIAQNPIYGEIVGQQLMKLYPEAKEIVKSVLKKTDAKALDELTLRSKLKDGFDQYYANNGRNITEPLYIKIRDMILNPKYVTKIKNKEGFLKGLKNAISPDAMKTFGTLLSGWWRTADSLQKSFNEVAERAARKIENGDSILEEKKEMFRILAATKKWWKGQSQYILDAWLEDDFFKLDPKGAQVKSEFQSFTKNDADYKELFDILTKDRSFWDFDATEWIIERLQRYRSLWPFKSPKSPDGYWYFSNKFTPSRIVSTILTKDAKNIQDLNRYLLRKGVIKGTLSWFAQRFIYIYVIFPVLVAYWKSVVDWTEEGASWVTGLYDGEPVDWVDFENVPDEFRKQSYIFMKDVGNELGKQYSWWDNQTWANEVYWLNDKLFNGKNGDEVQKEYKKRNVTAAAAFGPELQQILATGEFPQTTQSIPSNSTDTPIRVSQNKRKTT